MYRLLPLPSPYLQYWIARKLNPVIYDISIEWRGIWTVGLFWIIFQLLLRYCLLRRRQLRILMRLISKMSDDLNYWQNDSYPIAFQIIMLGSISVAIESV